METLEDLLEWIIVIAVVVLCSPILAVLALVVFPLVILGSALNSIRKDVFHKEIKDDDF